MKGSIVSICRGSEIYPRYYHEKLQRVKLQSFFERPTRRRVTRRAVTAVTGS